VTAVVDETKTVTLAERLAELEAAETPLAVELNRLRSERADALDRHDYARIVELDPLIDAAREKHALAASDVTVLRQYADEIRQEREQAQREVALQQQRDAARVELAAAQETESRYLAELKTAVAAIDVGVDAVHKSIAHALELEGVAHAARLRAYQAMVVLGERKTGVHVPRPNDCSALLESSAVVRMIYKLH
jgi:hypothetical protein